MSGIKYVVHNFTYVKLAHEQIHGKPKKKFKVVQILRLSDLFLILENIENNIKRYFTFYKNMLY